VNHRDHFLTSPPSPWADSVGVWTSALCVVHCLVTPFILSFSAVLAHFLPSEESTHRSLAVFIAFIGALATLRGFRTHRRRPVLFLMAAGLSFIFSGAWFGDLLPRHWMEIAITFVGSACMISAHRFNHTFCKQCTCANPQTVKRVRLRNRLTEGSRGAADRLPG
jgi:hypothetical protein